MSEVWSNTLTEEQARQSNLEYDQRMAAIAEAGRKVLEARGVKNISWTAVEKRVAAANLESRSENAPANDGAWRADAEKRSAEIEKQLDEEWLAEARKRSDAVEAELRSSTLR